MTTEELLKQLYDATLVGNAPEVLSLTDQGLAKGLGPETLLYEALIPSLRRSARGSSAVTSSSPRC